MMEGGELEGVGLGMGKELVGGGIAGRREPLRVDLAQGQGQGQQWKTHLPPIHQRGS